MERSRRRSTWTDGGECSLRAMAAHRGDRDELVIDALTRGRAQQVLDHPLAFVVLALAEGWYWIRAAESVLSGRTLAELRG
jgi:hypothetical protein